MKNFAKVKNPSESVMKYLTQDRIEKIKWYDLPGYNGSEIPMPVLLKEPFLKEVDKEFGLTGCALLRWPEKTAYFWHNDSDRNSTINMVINNGTHSHTMFGEKMSDFHMEIEELIYDPGFFYIFNTQVSHEMINLGKERYLLTTRIKSDPTYKELFNWALKNNLLDIKYNGESHEVY
jgi:hypothetical protein